MEFRQIQTFMQIAQVKNFSKTAELLGYSQSAVTVQIRQLETELGVRLFDRTGKKSDTHTERKRIFNTCK